jgi:hypothetical protein
MSTPIFKVSDGSTITFKKRGPELYAVLSTPSGQVINGPSRMSNTEESAAREILLANNIVDPNNGEPLPYTIEGSQDSSGENTNKNSELPRVTLSEAPDNTALNIAKTNQEILKQDNQALTQALNSELPPEVRFTNFINNQKSTLKKRLIPFVIDLITPMAPQIIPLVVSNLGISGDTTVDSLKSSAKEKADEAKQKANDAKDAASNAKDKAKDKDALKAAALAASPTILSRIPIEQLTSLINCPSSATIQSIIKKRNLLVNQINGIYKTTSTLTKVLGITNTVLTTIQLGIQLAKSNPYPATGVPPLGLPPLTSGAQTTIASYVAKLENQLKVINKNVSTITITVGSFSVLLGTILKFLSVLDVITQYCAEDQIMNFEAINDEINALANPTVVATQNNSDKSNINTYKGFTLGVKIDEKNESKYIRRYAVAQNKQGVPVLRTDSSFTSDPAVLISQLKFIIDTNFNITAE